MNRELTLSDPCARNPREDKKHEDDGGMFFFTCRWCGLRDEDDLDVCAAAMTDTYPRFGR